MARLPFRSWGWAATTVAAVLAVLIGLGLGYYLWGVKAADPARQIQEQ